jgi:hypothetical protein
MKWKPKTSVHYCVCEGHAGAKPRNCVGSFDILLQSAELADDTVKGQHEVHFITISFDMIVIKVVTN